MDWKVYWVSFKNFAIEKGVPKFDVVCSEFDVWELWQKGMTVEKAFEKIF